MTPVSHNVLLWEGLAASLPPRDRQALGIPPRFRIAGATAALRIEELPPSSAKGLLAAIREEAEAVRLTRERGRRQVFLTLCPDGWGRLRRRLSAAEPPLSALAQEIATTLRSVRHPPRRLRLARRTLSLGRRTLIQGILNVTPDSFFDGGRWVDPGRAAERAFQMAEEGADLIDVGGESTRPGSRSLGAREETRRVLPVIERLAGRLSVPLSIDTTKAEVAQAALSAGAEIINDISGLTFDSRLAQVAARHGAGLIISHIRGRPRTMQKNPRYRHLIPEVLAFLRRSIRRALAAGVDLESILVDPGIGFGKTYLHNLLLLRHLSALRCSGRPILVGASRKSFLGAIAGESPEGRLEGSLAAAALAIQQGASVLRVHDVAATVRVARVVEAVRGVTMK